MTSTDEYRHRARVAIAAEQRSQDLGADLQQWEASLAVPTPDQSYCDVGMHQRCSGYTEDEADPESCFCQCHDLDPEGA